MVATAHSSVFHLAVGKGCLCRYLCVKSDLDELMNPEPRDFASGCGFCSQKYQLHCDTGRDPQSKLRPMGHAGYLEIVEEHSVVHH